MLRYEEISFLSAITINVARAYELSTRINASEMHLMKVSALEVPRSNLVAASFRRKRENASVSEM